MTTSSVSAVVVSYNVKDLLLDCVESLEIARSAGALDEIIVVDNSSTDGSADTILQRFPSARVLSAPNRGYGAGANVGISAATSDYILVLNPDTTVPASTISCLSRYMDRNHTCAIAAPRMRYPDGTIQRSRRRFPTRLTPVFESTIFERWWPRNPWATAYHMTGQTENHTQEVDWVVGACLLVRKSAIDTAGAFDESFFMYCEEIEWCWRLRHHGWSIDYLPSVEITHHEGASTRQDVFARQLAFDRSRVELQRRLYGRLTAAVVATGIRIGYAALLIEESMKYVVRHKRDLRHDRVRLYRRLFTSSLRFVPAPPS